MSLFTLSHRIIPHEHVAYALAETGYGSKPSEWAHIPPSMAFFVSNELIRQVKELLAAQEDATPTADPLAYIHSTASEVLEDMPPCDLVQDGPQTIVVEVGDEITFNVDVYDRYVLCYPNDSTPGADRYSHEKELPEQGDSKLAANQTTA